MATLAYIHEKDIVYRDLKPENIMMCSKGYIKMIDFGLAVKLQGSRTYTACGTPQYIAPEVLDGKGYGVSADYWSLGILIFELICGRTPFDSEDPYDILEMVRSSRVRLPYSMDRSCK